MACKQGRECASATQRFVEALEERKLLAGVLLKDINTATDSSNPSGITPLGSSAIFIADDGQNGPQVWKANSSGAIRLTTARPLSIFPQTIVRMNNFVYFAANDGTGVELWRTDGTPQNTIPITTNISTPASSATIEDLSAVGGKLLFTASTSTALQLWSSTGLAAGDEQLLKQFAPGLAINTGIIDSNGTGYFILRDGAARDHLWKSDGTDSGTLLVKDLPAAFIPAADLTAMQGLVYFRAGLGLWSSDGTDAGTFQVKQLVTSPAGLALTSMVSTATRLFFVSGNSPDRELWQSDGRADGTTLVKDIMPGIQGANLLDLTVLNGIVLFSANDGTHGAELWRSDGTANGTSIVLDAVAGVNSSNPRFFKATSGFVYFQATGTAGTELWRSDGTAQGTTQVADIFGGSGSSTPAGFVDANGTIYFSATDASHGTELWSTDGTATGTHITADLRTNTLDARIGDSLEINGILYFDALNGATGRELWKTDGTTAGTMLLKDVAPGPDSADPYGLINVSGTLFFSVRSNGGSLWKSDGTEAGTVMVSDQEIYLGGTGYETTLEGTLYYVSGNGNELWKSDGTPGGTKLVYQGGANSSQGDLTAYNGKVYFSQWQSSYGRELWVTDGTAGGTQLVKDINVGTGDSRCATDTRAPVIFNNFLYFCAQTPDAGPELWRTDGTAAGTRMVYDSIYLGDARYGLLPHRFHVMGDYLYFAGDEDANGEELWRTNGTSNGTEMVANIAPGKSASIPGYLTDLNGILYFNASDGTHGDELFRSDGTAAGTWMVKDLMPGSTGLFPNPMVTFANQLWFMAGGFSNSPPQAGLWISDGTLAGTQLINSYNSTHTVVEVVNGKIVFPGFNSATGEELYTITPPTARAGGPYQVAAGQPLTLDASLSTSALSDAALTYTWDLDGDGIFGETGSAAARGDEIGAQPSFISTDLLAGDWKVWLRVADSEGAAASAPINITISLPPFMLFSGDAQYTWIGSPGSRRLTLNAGTLTLTAPLESAYPATTIQLDSNSRLRIEASQQLKGLTVNFTASVSLANHAVIETPSLVLNTGTVLDIGDGVLHRLNPTGDQLTTINSYVKSHRIISSLTSSDSRLGIAAYFEPQHAGGAVTIRAALLGDLNVDDIVSIADFIDVASNFNSTNATWAQGDTNYDGTVSIADFITLASNFNQTYSPIAPQPAAAITATVEQQKVRPHRRRSQVHHRGVHRDQPVWSAQARRWGSSVRGVV